MERKKILVKHKDNPTSFKPGFTPWNKGLVGYMKGRIVSTDTREKLRISSTGRKHTDETKGRMSEIKKKLVGSLNPFYGKKHSHESRELNRQKTTERWEGKSYRCKVMTNRLGKQSGKNNPRWKGGITPFNEMVRHCDKYVQWIRDVFNRDNFTCKDCGVRGGNLEAHHKKEFYIIMAEFLTEYDQFSPYEDKETLLRLAMKYEPFWEVGNGKTLCSKCHNITKGAIHGA
jgi:hypothetical protein